MSQRSGRSTRAYAAGLLLVRVAAGTALFVIVLLVVQSPDARIAGMMLTFPALNGISLMLAPTDDRTGMARSMLATISLNGVVGLGFITAFELMALHMGDGAVGVVWPAIGATFVVWFAIFWVIAGLPTADHWIVRGFSVLAVAGAWWLWVRCPGLASSSAPTDAGTALARHGPRIGLFALTLGLLLAAGEWLGASSRLLGKLGALPLLPLFSLATIAETSGGAAGAVFRFQAVKPAMLLGLLLAMAFALAYGRFLDAVRHRAGPALIGLLTGWLICGAVIFAGMWAATSLEGCRV